MRTWAVVVIIVGVLHASARADDGKPVAAPPDPYSPYVATIFSMAATAASVGVIAYGVDRDHDGTIVGGALLATIAPSAGHWYAHDYLTVGLAARAVGGALVVKGLVDGIAFDCQTRDPCNTGMGELELGLIAFAAGTIYDIATAPLAARRANRAARARAPTVTPMVAPGRVGLAIGGQF